MAVQFTPPEAVGPFLMRHLLIWEKDLRNEHTDLFKKIAHLRGTMRAQDKQIGKSKKKLVQDSITDEQEARRKSHEQLDSIEWKAYSCSKILKKLESTIDLAIAEYSRLWHMQFTTQLFTRLPREIRDMVYNYLLDPEVVHFIGDQVRHQVNNNCCASTPCAFSYELPHIVDSSFIFPPMTTEVMDMAAGMYASSNHDRIDAKDIRTFLTTQALHMDVPASSFFSNVMVTLHLPNMLEQYHPSQESSDAAINTEYFQRQIRNLLLDIPPYRDRILRIVIVEGEVFSPRDKIGSNTKRKDGMRSSIRGALDIVKARDFKWVTVNWSKEIKF